MKMQVLKNKNFLNIIKKITKKNPEFIVLGFCAFIIIFLINKVPINPDEYLYSAIGKNLASSYRGESCFSCIDSFHTFLLPFLISIFNFITSIDSIIVFRLIISLFSIGSIFLLYKIFKEIFKGAVFNSLILLLLFPGFFYFGGMFWLDNLAFFFFLLVVYFIIKNKNYWKVGFSLALMFLSKEYYIIFGGFFVFVAISYDTLIDNKEKNNLWKLRFFICNITKSFLPFFAVLLTIILFPIFPNPNLLNTFIIEFLGTFYIKIGLYIKEFLYGVPRDIKILEDTAGLSRSLDFLTNNFIVIKENFNIILLKYFKSIFKEIFVNLYVLPLALCGIFIAFKEKIKNIKNNKKISILMLSIVFVFFLFSIRTAATGEHGFRVALIVILPFIYFIKLSIGSLLNNKRLEIHWIFFIFSFTYILVWLIGIQKMDYNSFLSDLAISQIFIKYKFIFNLILYAFPVIIIILNRVELETKKKILICWLFLMFSYKIIPEIANSYMVNQKYDFEYSLSFSREKMISIEKDQPIVLTNYEMAYYYYSNSTKMPNDIRKELFTIRPKPRHIYERRILQYDSEEIFKFTKEQLCDMHVDYIFYVNNEYARSENNKKIKGIKGIIIKKEFFKEGEFQWGLYQFEKSSCN